MITKNFNDDEMVKGLMSTRQTYCLSLKFRVTRLIGIDENF